MLRSPRILALFGLVVVLASAGYFCLRWLQASAHLAAARAALAARNFPEARNHLQT